ncbi:phosphatase PAP2 family protein [Mucilaginibacter robiniae]|uniref:Phosphatase PAP2 family protein n=1 Tax=Mucilaginibacter robiniae TaxID=2728022 RepID=A0A7L5E5J7_9SPHI|nr:phosphatase PAP2 family protein [Mucilaginibacter robiniae]QJD97044.1 phosphatase PAP2 family protein [Mucilaginibacter robiniae]
MRFKLFLLQLLLCLTFVARSQNIDVKMLNFINPNSNNENKGWAFLSNHAIIVSAATPLAMLAAGFITKDDLLKRNAITATAALLTNTLVTDRIKDYVQRQRPYLTWNNKIYLEGHTSGYSFPSGHTSTTFNVATSLSLSFPKWYVIAPAYTFAAATAYSRMYRGAHYPSDVLGGMIVGAGTSFLSYKLQKMFYRHRYNHTVHTGF